MSSAFFGLNTAYTGLIAANAGLNTTANNIANIETEGYSRQTVRQQAAVALRTYASYGCAGAGVDTLSAERQRNEYYDVKYRNNNANLGQYDKKAYFCKLIENYLTDSSTSADGFSTIFSKMMANLQTAMDAGGDTSVLMNFVGSAENLCEYFNVLYDNLLELQNDANQEIKVDVDQVNSIAQEIAQLNKQINMIEMDGRSIANELRDQRDVLVDELSQIIDTETKEYTVYDAITGEDTGAKKYIVTIAGGQNLVDGNYYRQLEYVPREHYEHQSQNEAKGLYDIIWADTKEEIGLYGDIGGELKGLIDIRDGNNGEWFHGKVSGIDSVNQQVTITVEDSYLMDINKNTMAANGQITISGQKYIYDSWTYKETKNPITGEKEAQYVFQLSTEDALNPKRIKKDDVGEPADIGNCLEYQGIPYYLEQINEWVRCYADAYNNIVGGKNVSDIYGNSTTGQKFFTGDVETDNTQYQLKVAHDSTTYSSSDDSYYRLTAANFAVKKEITQNAGLMGTHTDVTDGAGKTDILADIYNLSTDKNVLAFRGCSSEDFLICVLGDVALNASSANSFTSIYASMSETIGNQRLSISGVDTDEEAAYLMSYQNAYNLSSKMISVLTEVYDQLILNTGV